MANTWFDQCNQSTNATTTCYGIKNGSATHWLNILRVGVINRSTVGAGTMKVLTLSRYTATITWVVGTATTPQSMDTTNGALDTCTTGGSGAVSTTGSIHLFRRWCWGATFGTVETWTMGNALQCLVPMNIIFDAGYHDSDLQPMVLNVAQGMFLLMDSTINHNVEVWVEFTDNFAA